jgi:hypothetical protein
VQEYEVKLKITKKKKRDTPAEMARPYKRAFVEEHEEPVAEAPEEQVVRKVIDLYLFVYNI